eukprot:16443685-Heterocapsa_arctica.AAC.1
MHESAAVGPVLNRVLRLAAHGARTTALLKTSGGADSPRRHSEDRDARSTEGDFLAELKETITHVIETFKLGTREPAVDSREKRLRSQRDRRLANFD